jgi:hypothetical protein
MTRFVRLDQVQQFAAINVLSDLGLDGGPIVIPLTWQVGFEWTTASGKRAHNVLYGTAAAGFNPTVSTVNAMMSVLTTGTQWANLAAQLAPTTAFAALTIKDVRTEHKPVLPSTNPPVPGTSATAEMPDEVALCITFRTADTGPGNRGRIYIPGWSATALAAGNVASPTAVSALNAWAQTIASCFSGSGLTLALGLRHRNAYTSPITGTDFPERQAVGKPVTIITVRDNHWDSQRRRGLR